MATVETSITAEEFLLFADNGQPLELVRGRIVSMNMPAPRHGQICAGTVYLLKRFLEVNDQGHVVSNDSGVVTERDPDTVRGADVAFYSYEQIPKGPLPEKYLDIVPRVVFEVRSPTDRWSKILAKVVEYLEAGVIYVCVLDAESEIATVYHAERSPQKLSGDEELTFPEVLPGFHAAVRQFFE